MAGSREVIVPPVAIEAYQASLFEDMVDKIIELSAELDIATDNLSGEKQARLQAELLAVHMASRLARESDEHEDTRSEKELLEESVQIDDLTALLRKDAWKQHVEERMKMEQPFGVLFIDLRRFKRVNDALGHDFGDEVIEGFAHVLRKSIRDTDIAYEHTAGRMGGDEFAVLCDLTNRDGSLPADEELEERLAIISDRIRDHFYIFLDEVDEDQLAQLGFNMNIGGAVWREGMDLKQLLRAADAAMYQDKREMIKAEQDQIPKPKRVVLWAARTLLTRFGLDVNEC